MFEEKGLPLSAIQAQTAFLRSDLFDIIDALMERNPRSDAIKVLVSKTIGHRVDYIRQLVLGTVAVSSQTEFPSPPCSEDVSRGVS